MINDSDGNNTLTITTVIAFILAMFLIVTVGFAVKKDIDRNETQKQATVIGKETLGFERKLIQIPSSYGKGETTGSYLFYDSYTCNVYIRAYPDTHNGVGIAQYMSKNGNPYRYNPDTGKLEEYIPEYIQMLLDKLDNDT